MSKAGQRRKRNAGKPANGAKGAKGPAAPAKPAAIAPGMDTTRRASSTTDQVFANYNPRLTDANSDWDYERTPAVARTRHLTENEGLAAAAVNRPVSMIVGGNFRFSSKPSVIAKRLGIPLEAAQKLAGQIEKAWESWANDPLNRCDWEGVGQFADLVNLTVRHRVRDGEGLAVMRWDEDPMAAHRAGWRWRSSLQVLDPDRLSNPQGKMNSPTLHNGIEGDGRRNTFYHIRECHPADPSAYGGQFRWEKVPVSTAWGRPIIIHLRKRRRAGEMRGVAELVAVLRTFKALQSVKDSEIQASAVNAMYAGFIKTMGSKSETADALGQPEEIAARNAMAEAYYEGVDPRTSDGARIARLLPGDEFELFTAPRYAPSFGAFQTAVLQSIASGLGMSYEQLSMDFSKTNYSSVRAALVETWRNILEEREMTARQLGFPVLLCLVEEGIDNGLIDVPAGAPPLYENPAGWLAGDWIGPGRGWVDPVKEIDAASKRIASGMSTLEAEVAEHSGGSWEGIPSQIAAEIEAFKKHGLVHPFIAAQKALSVQTGTPPAEPGDAEDNEIDARPGDADRAVEPA